MLLRPAPGKINPPGADITQWAGEARTRRHVLGHPSVSPAHRGETVDHVNTVDGFGVIGLGSLSLGTAPEEQHWPDNLG